MVDQARHEVKVKKLQLASTSWHFFVVKFAIDSSAAMYNIASSIANYYFFDGEVSFFSVVGSC